MAWTHNLGSMFIGCRFVGSQSVQRRQGNSSGEYWTAENSRQTGGVPHWPSDACKIVGCVFDTGTIGIGNYGGGGYTTDARNCRVEACTRNSAPMDTGNGVTLGTYETGTVVTDTTAEVYVAASQLSANQVGLEAADPLCPSGPQS